MPPGYSMAFSGQVKILEETTTNMLLAFGLASIFMYMVLAAQFESLAHPFVILLTLPLSIPFASFAHRHRPFAESFQRAWCAVAAGNREEERHSADRLHEPASREGYSVHDAVIEANRVRLRPDPDDDAVDRCRTDTDRIGSRSRSFAALGHRGHDHRWPDALLLLTLLVVPSVIPMWNNFRHGCDSVGRCARKWRKRPAMGD